MQTKRLFLWMIAATVAVAAGMLASQRHYAPKAADSAAVQQLMKTQLPDLNGKSQSLGQWQGRVLVVNFWAPWCPPCVAEMPDLAATAREFAGKNVQFVGIGIDSAQNMLAFEKKVKVDYPLLVAGYAGTDLARALGNTVGALPFTVVVDSQEKIRLQKLGRITPEELRSTLNSL